MDLLRKTETYIYADRDLLVHNIEEVEFPYGLFEIDINGNLMPVLAVQSDNYYELDASGNIMPLAA